VGKQHSVLVIDDEMAVLKSVAMCLHSSEWLVFATDNPKEALEIAKRHTPDVILCDASMPDLSGPQIITTLGADATTAGIPVVLMSGYADAEMFSHVAWKGFLGKPFGVKELKEALQSVVRYIPPKIE